MERCRPSSRSGGAADLDHIRAGLDILSAVSAIRVVDLLSTESREGRVFRALPRLLLILLFAYVIPGRIFPARRIRADHAEVAENLRRWCGLP